MSQTPLEDRSFDPDDGDAAMATLREGVQRVKQHVEVFRAVTGVAPATDSTAEPDAL